MRGPAFLLLPIALVSLAPRAASAQEGFGAVVVRAEAPPPPVLLTAPTPDVEIRRVRSPGMIAGGSVLATLGVIGVASSAVWIHGLESQAADCSTQQGFAGVGCAIGGIGRGIAEAAGWSLALMSAGALAGGVVLIVKGASPPSAKVTSLRPVPEVSLAPGAIALKWTF